MTGYSRTSAYVALVAFAALASSVAELARAAGA
jgi:hypothetical protein